MYTHRGCSRISTCKSKEQFSGLRVLRMLKSTGRALCVGKSRGKLLTSFERRRRRHIAEVHIGKRRLEVAKPSNYIPKDQHMWSCPKCDSGYRCHLHTYLLLLRTTGPHFKKAQLFLSTDAWVKKVGHKFFVHHSRRHLWARKRKQNCPTLNALVTSWKLTKAPLAIPE